jgi:hypothetical protein
MSYDDFEHDGVRLNGDPATPETLRVVDTLAREFLTPSPVISRLSIALNLEGYGTLRLDTITEISGKDNETTTEAVYLELEDDQEKPLASVEIPEDGKSTAHLHEGVSPKDLLDLVNAFHNSGELTADENVAADYLELFGLSLQNQSSSSDLIKLNSGLKNAFADIKRAVSAKALFGVFSMQRDVPTSEGEIEVASYWVLPIVKTDEVIQLAHDTDNQLPRLSIRLTDFTTGYGHELVYGMKYNEADDEYKLGWSIFPIDPLTQQLDAETVDDNPALLEIFDLDDTPGETDVQDMINALIEASVVPAEND